MAEKYTKIYIAYDWHEDESLGYFLSEASAIDRLEQAFKSYKESEDWGGEESYEDADFSIKVVYAYD